MSEIRALNFPLFSVADLLAAPSLSLADTLNEVIVSRALLARRSIAITEIGGASIGYSFRDIETLRERVGSSWLSTVTQGLDVKDPEVIRPMIELGVRGVDPSMVLEALGLDRLAEYVANALILRIK